ncbi:hemicentin-1 [Elysia marginata]|uniref:Hemicentin-1 n=1 Tax=Elysia marginata TaxID=1093978 RepID=A0AAV4FC42_9GAST|nr:hemicentin-1 [Elysia marginata]
MTNQLAPGEPRYNHYHPRKNPYLPFFRPTPNNVTFIRGQEAVLQCAVENRGTKTVVWRKKPQKTPISIGETRFITDTRFRIVHREHSLTWNLHIKDVIANDSGTYECQVVSTKRKIRQNIDLNVDESAEAIKPKITINGTLFMEKGQTLKLICNATGSGYPPDAIDWFKDGSKIKSNGRVTLTNDVSLAESTISSILSVRRGLLKDAGTYVCRTSDLQVTSARVNILNISLVAESSGVTSIGGGGTYDVQRGEEDPKSNSQRRRADTVVLIFLIVTLQLLRYKLIT